MTNFRPSLLLEEYAHLHFSINLFKQILHCIDYEIIQRMSLGKNCISVKTSCIKALFKL